MNFTRIGASLLVALWSVLLVAILPTGTTAADKDDLAIALAGGKLTMKAPKDWIRKKPRTRIVEHEFAVTAVKGDKINGRVTFMRAGGGVEANIQRWMNQFTQPDGKLTKERTVIKKLKIAGQQVRWVDIRGTYKDRRGPVAPAVLRKDYRMLGAIIGVKDLGDYFVKLYGPRRTISDSEKSFEGLIKSLRVK